MENQEMVMEKLWKSVGALNTVRDSVPLQGKLVSTQSHQGPEHILDNPVTPDQSTDLIPLSNHLLIFSF